MLTAVLLSLLIHIIWLNRAYTHTSPEITKRVRASAAVASLIVTSAVACLLVENGRTFLYSDKPAASESAHAEVARMVEVLGGPENYLRYLEIDKTRKLP